jgi:hypothetical protein
MSNAMTEHTPGPWREYLLREPIRLVGWTLGRQIWARDSRIAFVIRQEISKAEDAANARVMAAAPELLAALLIARETIDALARIHNPAYEIYMLIAPEIRTIDAAIAKATGGKEERA